MESHLFQRQQLTGCVTLIINNLKKILSLYFENQKITLGIPRRDIYFKQVFTVKIS